MIISISSSIKRMNLVGVFNMHKLWYIWAKALGDKAGKHNKEADIIALVRTLIVLVYLITNLFIVAGIIHHW